MAAPVTRSRPRRTEGCCRRPRSTRAKAISVGGADRDELREDRDVEGAHLRIEEVGGAPLAPATEHRVVGGARPPADVGPVRLRVLVRRTAPGGPQQPASHPHEVRGSGPAEYLVGEVRGGQERGHAERGEHAPDQRAVSAVSSPGVRVSSPTIREKVHKASTAITNDDHRHRVAEPPLFCPKSGRIRPGGLEGRAVGHSPVAPSMASRRRSAWPTWRAYSSITCSRTNRTSVSPNSGFGTMRARSAVTLANTCRDSSHAFR